MLRRFALALGLALAVALPAAAQDFEKGLAAAHRGDYATAHKEWQPLVEQGHSRAQFNFGVLFDRGLGVRQDYGEAVKWYGKAAEQGVPKAQFNLGNFHRLGRGVPRSFPEAVKWYGKAAAQGHAYAQFNLALLNSRRTPKTLPKYVAASKLCNAALFGENPIKIFWMIR